MRKVINVTGGFLPRPDDERLRARPVRISA
jgi:hypothetical protein